VADSALLAQVALRVGCEDMAVVVTVLSTIILSRID
jgi:hypothetical protein